MKILIDADGCPVVGITVEIAKEFNIETVIISDTSHIFESDYAKTIVVSKGSDSADFYIVNHSEKNDIVITQDFGLAAMCLARNAIPINQYGFVYDNSNIDAMLMRRHENKRLRQQGIKHHGRSIKKRTKDDDEKFALKLRSVLENLMY